MLEFDFELKVNATRASSFDKAIAIDCPIPLDAPVISIFYLLDS